MSSEDKCFGSRAAVAASEGQQMAHSRQFLTANRRPLSEGDGVAAATEHARPPTAYMGRQKVSVGNRRGVQYGKS